jgi:hypothetical protein
MTEDDTKAVAEIKAQSGFDYSVNWERQRQTVDWLDGQSHNRHSSTTCETPCILPTALERANEVMHVQSPFAGLTVACSFLGNSGCQESAIGSLIDEWRDRKFARKIERPDEIED